MKILIVRLSAMGDVIHAMPAVAGLRQAFPECEIDWAIEERWSSLLTACPDGSSTSSRTFSQEQPLVNAVHSVHMRHWRRTPFSNDTLREIRALRAELRSAHYDHVIDLQGAIRSALLARISGAKIRAGALHPRELPARWFYNVKAHTPARHVIEQAAEIVSASVGQPISPTEQVPFPHSLPAEQWADDVTRGVSTQFVIINPGAGWGAKRWPGERYGALVSALAKHGIDSLVNAGPGENKIAQEVCRGNPNAHVVECSLLQLIALTRRAALFVGGDTGPVHLASALNIPVVAIFGPTDPARNGPYAGQSTVLRSPESKRDHSRRTEPEAGLLNITVEQVTESALRLLGVRP